MLSPIRNFKENECTQLRKQTINKSQAVQFKAGFVRLEKYGIFTKGGMSVWNEKTQRMISRSLSKEKLAKLMESLEKTENERILFCDIQRCGIFKRRLSARFACTKFLENFTENFKQKTFESKWKFLMRMLNQFDAYKNQIKAMETSNKM